jgi:hypothetical protein
MTNTLTKSVLFSLVVLFAFSGCKKEKLFGEDTDSMLFGKEGRSYTFTAQVYSNLNPLYLDIPAEAVQENSTLLYFQYKLANYNGLDSFLIDGPNAIINLFSSSAQVLQKPASIRFPFTFAVNFTMSSGYRPYKIKYADIKDIMPSLNDPSRWEQIPSFTYDNTTKYISFDITDLNAIYVIAKKK